MILVDGIALSSYRSFGDNLQLLGPFDKINIIIGQNNSGKSNVLRFLKEQVARFVQAERQSSNVSFNELDLHIGSSLGSIRFGMSVSFRGRLWSEITSHLTDNYKSDPHRWDTQFNALLSSPPMRRGTDQAWFIYERKGNKIRIEEKIIEDLAALAGNNDIHWKNLFYITTGRQGGGLNDHILGTLSGNYILDCTAQPWNKEKDRPAHKLRPRWSRRAWRLTTLGSKITFSTVRAARPSMRNGSWLSLSFEQ